MQQIANKKVKHTDNDYNNSHPNTKTWTPSVATSTSQISPFKSPKPSNVARQPKFQGISIINPYLNTKDQSEKITHYKKPMTSTSTAASKVSPLKSPTKTTTIQTPPGITTPPTKVSLINSNEETNRVQRYDSQPKRELKSEPASNKLHAYEIDWVDIKITTTEDMKYPNFTKIEQTQQSILNFGGNQFKQCDIKFAFTALIGKIHEAAFNPLPSQKVKLIESFLELVYDENSMMVNTTNQHTLVSNCCAVFLFGIWRNSDVGLLFA